MTKMPRYRGFLAAGLLVLGGASFGATLPAGVDGAATIPTRTDATDRMLVDVRIGSEGPFNFVIDTGAERTVISAELAARLGLPDAGSAQLHSLAETATVPTVLIPALMLEGRTVENIRAPALAQRHIGAAGILGIDSLHDQRVILDFRARRLLVMPATRRPEAAPDGSEEIVVRARSRLGRLVLANAQVDGRKVNVIIDTGAEVSLGNLALLARFSKARGLRSFEVMSVTGGKVAVTAMALRNVQIERLRFSDMPVAISDAHIFRQLGFAKRPALLLGMDVLRGFDLVSIDFANREVRFILPGESRARDGEAALAMSGR